jgi:predicted negative regulator of RcsB-dependent stress response
MEKEKLPIEKDVDLELEYKVYRIYDFLKKHFKFVLAFLLLLIVISGGLYYKSQIDKQNREKASLYLSKIDDLLSEDKLEDAKKELENFKKQYGDTEFYKVALAYEILINKEENKEPAEKLKNELKTDLSSGVNEYLAYLKNKEGNSKEAKEILKSIDSKKYNYISAQTLYALILKKEGNFQEAKKIFETIKNNQNYRYFSLLAKENL